MSDDIAALDKLAPAVRGRSTELGDVPDALARRYYTDRRGGDGLGFYTDATISAAAFRDRGRDLVATRLDPNAIRDMTAIAAHRGWSIVSVRGSAAFRREAWLASRAIGLEVRGYRATERDVQELERRTARRRRAEAVELGHSDREQPEDQATKDYRAGPSRQDARGRTQLQVIEAVVRARVADPMRQKKILAFAAARISGWLERGARFDPAPSQNRSERLKGSLRRDR